MSIYFKMSLWRTTARKWKWISIGLHNRKPILDTWHLHCGGQTLLMVSLCLLRFFSSMEKSKLSFDFKDLMACLEIFYPVFVWLTFNIYMSKSSVSWGFNTFLEILMKKLEGIHRNAPIMFSFHLVISISRYVICFFITPQSNSDERIYMSLTFCAHRV